MTPTESIINKWAKNLTESIISIKYFDAAEIENMLKIQMAIAMREALGIQLSDLEKNINNLKTEIMQGGSKQLQLQSELIKIKAQKTAFGRLNANVNHLLTNAKKQDIARQAYTFIYEKLGKEALEEFKNSLK